jgi:hypothetical protein
MTTKTHRKAVRERRAATKNDSTDHDNVRHEHLVVVERSPDTAEKSELRRKVAKDFSDTLLDMGSRPDFVKKNPDIVEVINEMRENPDAIIFMDDTVAFDNDICLTGCNGECCFGGILIRLTLPDLLRIFNSEGIRGRYASDEGKHDFLSLFSFFLGGESLVPMAIIKFNEHDACPFMGIALKLFDDGTNNVKRNVGGICTIGQRDKPIPCMLYPLGRVGFPPKDDLPEFVFFSRKCPATITDKRVRVEDLAGSLQERTAENAEYDRHLTSIVKTLKQELKDENAIRAIMNVIGTILVLEPDWMAILDMLDGDMPSIIAGIEAATDRDHATFVPADHHCLTGTYGLRKKSG